MASLPPPLLQRKKSYTGKAILIILLSIIGLCLLIVVISQAWSKTPEGKAVRTSVALTAAAKPTNAPIIITIENTPIHEPTEQETKIPTKADPTVTPTVVISSLSLQEIIDNSELMTEAQWKEYKKTLPGTYIRWSGFVYDVTKTLGLYSIDLCVIDHYCADDVFFGYPKEEAIKLNKDQWITVIGEISSVDTDFFGNVNVYLINATIVK